jgi:hypothetical protein
MVQDERSNMYRILVDMAGQISGHGRPDHGRRGAGAAPGRGHRGAADP